MRKVRIALLILVVLGIGGALVAFKIRDLETGMIKSFAQLRAKTLADMCHAYYLHPDSNEQYPKTLAELVKPPFKGREFLQNGEQDTLDPWGKPYGYEVRSKPDGEQFAFIFTTTPEGVLISQFGFGPKALPPE